MLYPASNKTTNAELQHLATVYYESAALDQLKQFFMFLEATEPDILPLRVGATVQFYRYGLFAANTQATPEGVNGVGIKASTNTVSATVQEFSDYLTTSSFLEETAIDSVASNLSENLGYRAALSVDTIARVEADAATALTPLGAYASAADIRRMCTLMEAKNVQPKLNTHFLGIAHPYHLYDLRSDNSPGGFIDAMRYANPQIFKEGLINNLNGEAGLIENTRFLKSNNVGTTTSGGITKYKLYVFGKGGLGAVSLSGRGPSKVRNPHSQSFRVNVIKGGPSMIDPEGKFGHAISYRFVWTVKRLTTGDDDRYRVLEAAVSLA